MEYLEGEKIYGVYNCFFLICSDAGIGCGLLSDKAFGK